jgi:DNA-binding transcriptional regulator YhcF (GntR family)
MKKASTKYQSIVEEIRDKIIRGELAPGTKLPGQFELAEQYGVSAITANRALNELRMHGLVERRERSGSYVAQSPRALSEILMVMSGEYDNQAQWLSPYWQTISGLAESDGISTQLISRRNPNFNELVFGNEARRLGIILLAFEDEKLIVELELKKIPHVVAGIEVHHAKYSSHENRRNAARALTLKLIDGGCRRLAFTGNLQFPNHRAARGGYQDAVDSSPVKIKSKIVSADEDSVVKAINKLLSRKNPPDGLIIAGGLMPFLARPSIMNLPKPPILGVMTENQDVLKLKGAATIASYSQKQTAELAYRLLLDVASGRVASPTVKLADFKIIPGR